MRQHFFKIFYRLYLHSTISSFFRNSLSSYRLTMRRPVARPCGWQRKTVGPLCHLPTIIECHLCQHYVFLNFQLISNTFYNNRVALRLGYFSVTFCHIRSKNSHWKLVRLLNLFGTFTFLYFKFNCHHHQKLIFCYNAGTFLVPFWYAPAPQYIESTSCPEAKLPQWSSANSGHCDESWCRK